LALSARVVGAVFCVCLSMKFDGTVWWMMVQFCGTVYFCGDVCCQCAGSHADCWRNLVVWLFGVVLLV